MGKYDLQTAGGVIQYLLPHAERAVQLKAARSRFVLFWIFSRFSAPSPQCCSLWWLHRLWRSDGRPSPAALLTWPERVWTKWDSLMMLFPTSRESKVRSLTHYFLLWATRESHPSLGAKSEKVRNPTTGKKYMSWAWKEGRFQPELFGFRQSPQHQSQQINNSFIDSPNCCRSEWSSLGSIWQL